MAYYQGTNQANHKPKSARGFTKGIRKTIISFGITDNPCNQYYRNVPSPNVKQTKSISSGTFRYSPMTSYY